MIASIRKIGTAILALCVASPSAVGQMPTLSTSLVPQLPRRDSADARKRALRAQQRFEQVRRYNLPLRYTGAGQVCDARIGRFCQWNDEDPRPPKEPNPIREARDVLIRALDAEAERSPGDDWIAGQRIRSEQTLMNTPT